MGEEITAAREEEEEEKRDPQSFAQKGGTSPSSRVSLLKIDRSKIETKKKIEKKRREIGRSLQLSFRVLEKDIKANFVFPSPHYIVLTLRYIIYII